MVLATILRGVTHVLEAVGDASRCKAEREIARDAQRTRECRSAAGLQRTSRHHRRRP